MIQEHLDRFYELLADLRNHSGFYHLSQCHGHMDWPERGIYFFFESGETRANRDTLRVVRIGTHAVSAGSKTTLWKRLSAHRGKQDGSGGNHRGSVFRKLIGKALLNRGDVDPADPDQWGVGSSAPRAVTEKEAHIEKAVSAYIGMMPFLALDVQDEPAKHSRRAVIESNAIALLSLRQDATNKDCPSEKWLGHHASLQSIRDSGLWNSRDTNRTYDPSFLDVMETYVRAQRSGRRSRNPSKTATETVGLIACVKSKATRPRPACELYTSPLFRKSVKYAKRRCDRYFVLSAKHGLVEPDRILKPYSESLVGSSVEVRRAWAMRVRNQMQDAGLLTDNSTTFLWLTGSAYKRHLSQNLDDFKHEDPLEGLGIGERLRKLNLLLESNAEPS